MARVYGARLDVVTRLGELELFAGVSGRSRLSPDICGEYARKLSGGQALSLVTGLPPLVCKSIAKASKVRILHLPPRAERALDQRKRRSWALSCCPGHQPSPLTLWGWSCPPMSWCLRSVAVRSWASRGRGPA